jgi:putative ABC transport system permease protein
MLMGAAICLLLIACANVANLLVVQASYREREFAVRSTLGAGRARLIRQTMIQALLLAGIATGVGAALAWIGLRLLLSIAPANLPRIDSVAFNGAALGCSVILGLMAAGIVGLLPAVRGSQTNIMAVLRTDGRAPALQISRVLRAVVVVEIALSFVLLVGAGLMLRSFAALQRLDPGFDARDMLTFQVTGNRLNVPEQRQAVMGDIYSRLDEIPGVLRVTGASPFPLADPFYPIRWGRDEALADESKFQAADYQVVLPGYFETLKTQLVAGRAFANADNAPERGVAIVDQLLARKAFGGAPDAVGERILVRIRTPEPEWVEIIGVVAHQRASALTDEGREQIYFTDGFLGHGAANRWAIRTLGDPVRYSGAVRAAIANVSPQLFVGELQPMDALVERSQARTRFAFVLMIVLASVAAMLAVVGVYGVLSTTVRHRTAEVGARMAFGAQPRSILTLILRQGLLLTAVGLALGLVGALVATRLMTTMLVAVEPIDTVTFVATGLLYIVIAGAACLLPARRAAKLDPLVALRGE